MSIDVNFLLNKANASFVQTITLAWQVCVKLVWRTAPFELRCFYAFDRKLKPQEIIAVNDDFSCSRHSSWGNWVVSACTSPENSVGLTLCILKGVERQPQKEGEETQDEALVLCFFAFSCVTVFSSINLNLFSQLSVMLTLCSLICFLFFVFKPVIVFSIALTAVGKLLIWHKGSIIVKIGCEEWGM